jgi:hypothetical protein
MLAWYLVQLPLVLVELALMLLVQLQVFLLNRLSIELKNQ